MQQTNICSDNKCTTKWHENLTKPQHKYFYVRELHSLIKGDPFPEKFISRFAVYLTPESTVHLHLQLAGTKER